MDRNFFSIDVTVVLFLALGRDKFAVETCDIAQRNILGHSAAHAPVLVQLPKPSSSILATILRARRTRST